jgi:molybdopterin converting factor small subunit
MEGIIKDFPTVKELEDKFLQEYQDVDVSKELDKIKILIIQSNNALYNKVQYDIFSNRSGRKICYILRNMGYTADMNTKVESLGNNDFRNRSFIDIKW